MQQREREKHMKKEEYNFENAKQGAVVQALPGKTRITIRLDTDILNWFREQVNTSGGGNYQTMINEALREYIDSIDGRLEKIVRKVIHEELQIFTKGA